MALPPTSSEFLPQAQTLWLCAEIKKQLPTIPPNEDVVRSLADRIGPLFAKKFPGVHLELDDIRICYFTRVGAVRKIRDSSSAVFTRTGSLDYSRILKSTLERNPNLSSGETAKGQTKIPFSRSRREYALKISRTAGWIDGKDLPFDELDQHIATIQQHIVWKKSADDFNIRIDEFLDLLLRYFSIAEITYSTSFAEGREILLQRCRQFVDAMLITPLDHINLSLCRQCALLSKKGGIDLWPDFVGIEPLVSDLMARCAKGAKSVGGVLERTETLLLSGMRIETNLSKIDFLYSDDDTPSSEFIEKMRAIGFTDDEIYESYKQLPIYSSNIRETIGNQLQTLLALNEELRTLHYSVSPAIDSFLNLWLIKDFIEYPHAEFDDRVESAQWHIEEIASHISRMPLFSSQTDPRFVGQIDRFAMQNDLAIPFFKVNKNRMQISDSFPLFPPYSDLLKMVQDQFSRYWDLNGPSAPHPLLNQTAILDRCETDYLAQYPELEVHRSSLQLWLRTYLKFVWYTHCQSDDQKNNPRRASPTVHLFLEWHAARLLQLVPDSDVELLTRTLKEIAQDKIPQFPINDLDLKAAIRPLLCAQGRKGFVPRYLSEARKISARLLTSEEKIN